MPLSSSAGGSPCSAPLPVRGPHVAHSDRISVEDHLQTVVRVFLEIVGSVVYNIVREFYRHRVRFDDLPRPAHSHARAPGWPSHHHPEVTQLPTPPAPSPNRPAPTAPPGPPS